MYQKCPICHGAGKLLNTETTSMYSVCKTCNGTGIINELTGLPPQQYQELTPNLFQEHLKQINKE